MVVTILAVLELSLFMGIVAPHFQMKNFVQDGLPFGISGIFAALPFAVWFYLGIEGVALVAEEVIDPKKNIPKGYLLGLITLILLAMGVMVFTGGLTNWHLLSNIDYPLPESISIVLGKSNRLTRIFAGIGLFGLIASFHGLMIGYSREIFALSRSRLLPHFLSAVNKRFQTPHWALLAGGVAGIVSLFTGTTDKVIIISALGAVFMYAISLLALLRMRGKEKRIDSSFKTPCYPWFPVIALVLSVVCMIAIIWYNLLLSLVFFAGLIMLLLLFVLTGRHKHRHK